MWSVLWFISSDGSNAFWVKSFQWKVSCQLWVVQTILEMFSHIWKAPPRTERHRSWFSIFSGHAWWWVSKVGQSTGQTPPLKMLMMTKMLLKFWCCPALLCREKMFWQVFGNLGSQCVRSKYQILKTSILGLEKYQMWRKYEIQIHIHQQMTYLFNFSCFQCRKCYIENWTKESARTLDSRGTFRLNLETKPWEGKSWS